MLSGLVVAQQAAENSMDGMAPDSARPMSTHSAMSHSFSRNLPMNRNGSGTSWHPDNTPMYAYTVHARKWTYMVHYGIFLRYTGQNSNNPHKRGSDQQFGAPN